MAFMLVEEVAQHFKHGQRRWVKKAKAANPGSVAHHASIELGDRFERTRNSLAVLSGAGRSHIPAQ
jgi:hypothetical protein